MSAFIMPVTIESRKILFLGLDPKLPSNINDMDPGEDEYILELPSTNRSKVCTISKSKNIQSLHDEVPNDLNLSYADIRQFYDLDNNTIIIDIYFNGDQEKATCISEQQPVLISNGLKLFLVEDSNEVALELRKSFDFVGNLQLDLFFVRFNLHCCKADEGVPFSALIKCFLAPRKDILLTGLDFGSESSQMIEGRYDDSGNLKHAFLDIFTSLKESKYPTKQDIDKTSALNSTFIQYESPRLYRSIFYAPKNISLPEGRHWYSGQTIENLNFITPQGELTNDFYFKSWQIPNLKLIHDNGEIGQEFRFKVTEENRDTELFLTDLKSGIYASLLKNIIVSTLKKKITHPVYLRFTLLVPNIYTIDEIRETKKIIRKIIMDEAAELSLKVKGLELSSMSESDAAFFGYMPQLKPKGGEYFIIIDCGKGTTDFSIIQAQKDDPRIMRPIFRNGFAGAGNLITFGFLESFFHYLSEGCAGNVNAERKLDDFRTGLSRSGMSWEKSLMEICLEKWKRNFSANDSANDVEKFWNTKGDARTDWTFWRLFLEDSQDLNVTAFRDVLMNYIPKAYDWGGYISKSVEFIVGQVSANLIPAITHLNKSARCGGILFTGRGFLFKPLESAIKAVLGSISGIKPHMFLDNTQINLKEICLQGIFTRNVLSYSDMASTPIEIEKGTLRHRSRKDIDKPSFKQILNKWIYNVTDSEDVYFSDETNSGLIRARDLAHCQFIIGGKVFEPDNTERLNFNQANIINTRKGFFIKAITDHDTVVITGLHKVGYITSGQGSVDAIKRSLFPGWLDPSYIGVKAS